MPRLGLPDPFDAVDRLIEEGDTQRAESTLDQLNTNPMLTELLRAKLALVNGSQPPGMVMQRLVQLMRQDKDLPGAQQLYMEASQRSYATRESSMAHSHPPPPSEPKRGSK